MILNECLPLACLWPASGLPLACLRPASGTFTKSYSFINYDTVSAESGVNKMGSPRNLPHFKESLLK